MTKRVLYLHLGLPKTATTFLQRHVFPKFNGVHYLGRKDGLNDKDEFLKVLTNYLHYYPSAALHNELDKVQNSLDDVESALYEGSDKTQPLFISDEGLTFRLFDAFDKLWFGRSSACFDNFIHRLSWLNTNGEYEIRPILVLRKQEHWLPSFYAQKFTRLHQDKRTASFSSFIHFALGEGYYTHGFNNLDFAEITKKVESRFPNVLILPYEQLKASPDEFIAELLRFTSSVLSSPLSLPEPENRAQVAKNKYSTHLPMEKDPSYLKIRAIKRKIVGRMPLPENWFKLMLKNYRYKGKEEFVVTEGEVETIRKCFSESNEELKQKYKNFEQYY